MSSWSSNIVKALRAMKTDIDTLPKYDDEAISQTKTLITHIAASAEDEDEPAKSALIGYANRLQNGINLYVRSRFLRIMDIKEKNPGPISSQVKKSFSAPENEFATAYIKAIAVYKKSLGFDPTTPCIPPKGLNASVSVLMDVGSVSVGNQWISLTKGDILTFRVTVAQELEDLGYVRIIEYLN